MKKRITYIIIASLFLISSCIEDDNPFADFTANHYSATQNTISFVFSDMSTYNAEEYIWIFEGGTPAISYDRNPIVTYDQAGTFNVSLTIKTSNGIKEITKYDYINIADFLNPTWADIHITQNSQTRVVGVDETILLSSIDDNLINYYAETYGSTAQGDQIGLLIYWDESIAINDQSLLWDFIIDDIFVFLNVRNDGSYNFNPFVVNFGDSEYEITDDITIPNNSTWVETGYYDAWDNMEVRAYDENDPYEYIFWEEGIHFHLLWKVNQGVDLWYDGTTKSLKSASRSKSFRRSESKPIMNSGVRR